MFIGPPKLVFIKTSEGGTTALRPGAPKGQTILVAQAPQPEIMTSSVTTIPTPSIAVGSATTISDDSPDEAPPTRVLRRHAAEKKYGKRQKTEVKESEEAKDSEDNQDNVSETSSMYFKIKKKLFLIFAVLTN